MRVSKRFRRIYGDPSTTVPPTDTFVIAQGTKGISFTATTASNQTFQITADRLTFTGNFTAVVTGLPTGITPTVTIDKSLINVQLAYNGTTAAGTYPFTVAITGGDVTKNFTDSLVINP